METTGSKKQNFAGRSPEERRRIASMGGKAAHASGNAYQFTPEKAREAARKSHLNRSRAKLEEKEG